MTGVTIGLNDELIETVTQKAHALQRSKSAYIRSAIEEMSTKIASQVRRESLMQASLDCRAESVRINKEFSNIEGDEHFDSTC